MITRSLNKKLNQILGERQTLGKVLRSIRLCDELNLKEFANLLGVSVSYLSDVEHGRKLVSAKKAYEYAEKLGYPVEEFLRLSLQDEANSFVEKKGHYANVSIQFI